MVAINIPPVSDTKEEITVAGEKEAVLKVTEYIKESVKEQVFCLLWSCCYKGQRIIWIHFAWSQHLKLYLCRFLIGLFCDDLDT